ncbi:494_t:CDS:1, partial [Cetraspora pellucida]
LALKSNKRIIKNQFLDDEKQILENDKMAQKHSDHNKYTSKPISTQEVMKAIRAPIGSVEIPIG